MKVQVLVKYKDDVPDAAGKLVARRLVEMGYPEVKDVRIGKAIVLNLDLGEEKTAVDKVKKMCGELLANPVSEEFLVQALGD